MSIQYQKVEWYEIAKVESGYYLRFSIKMTPDESLYFHGYTDTEFNITKISNLDYEEYNYEKKMNGFPTFSDIGEFIKKQRIQILFEISKKFGHMKKNEYYYLNERVHRFDGENLLPLSEKEQEELKQKEEEYYTKRNELNRKYSEIVEKELLEMGYEKPKRFKNYSYLEEEAMQAYIDTTTAIGPSIGGI